MSNNIHIKYCDSGIIKVIINTDTRWCTHTFFRKSDGRFVFQEDDEEGNTNKIYSFEVDFKPDTRYTRIEDQEKDQYYIYFIPTDMI